MHRGIAAPLAVCIAAIVGCGVSNRGDAPKGNAPASILAQPERVAVFEDVWKTIDEQYYDSAFHGVDWKGIHDKYRPQAEEAKSDVELYRMFELMLGELKDAHTSFAHPHSPADSAFQPTGDTGIELGEAEGRTVIAKVDSSSQPWAAGVRPGMILRSVNGRTVDDLYTEIRGRFAGSSTDRAMSGMMRGALLYGGFLGPARTFGIEGFDGRLIDVHISHFRAHKPDTVALSSSRLPSGDGYITFDGWHPPAAEKFGTALESLRNAPGLVIDLRGNGGGETEVLLEGVGIIPDRTVVPLIAVIRSGRDVVLERGEDELESLKRSHRFQ